MAYSAANLLARGYFPAELPPPFLSQSLGAAFQQIRTQLADVARAKPPTAQTQPVIYQIARQGTLRRRASIPHPIFQAQLCELIEQQSADLEAAIARSPWSSSSPTPNASATGRALDRKIREEKIVEEHARVRATSRYLVVTDIANCYASIYTHGISWALAGKPASKLFHRRKLDSTAPNYAIATSANKLDIALRAGQDSQSIGLPVGPDTSLIVAEAQLAGVDQLLQAKLPAGAVATRHVDDYQIGVLTYADGERVLADLQGLLRSELELELNPRKTRIVDLPDPLERKWVTDLKGIFREGKSPARQQRRDLLRLHDLAVAARQQNPDEHVLAYAAGILKKQRIDPSNWPLAQDMFLQAMMAEPGILYRLIADLKWYQVAGRTIDITRVQDVLTHLIVRHAPQGHSSEVAWALWAHVEFDVSVRACAEDALFEMDDPVVSVLALALRASGKLTKVPLAAELEPTEEDFWGDHWLLAYEGVRRGWLHDAHKIQKTKAFELLENAGVAFYDETRRMAPIDKPDPSALGY